MIKTTGAFLELEELAIALSDGSIAGPEKINKLTHDLVRAKVLQPEHQLDVNHEKERYGVIKKLPFYDSNRELPKPLHQHSFTGDLGIKQAYYLRDQLEKRRNGMPQEFQYEVVGLTRFQR